MQHALNGRAAEQLARIVDLELNPSILFIHHDAQRVIQFFITVLKLEFEQALAVIGRHRIVFKHEERVEQPYPRLLQRDQADIAVAIDVINMGLQAFDILDDRLIGVCQNHRQRIDI
ncbi:hypothetical protein D3C80_1467970 [compost metagenome]